MGEGYATLFDIERCYLEALMRKKRKPTDATIRNVKASKKRDDKLEKRIKKLRKEITEISDHLWMLDEYIDVLFVQIGSKKVGYDGKKNQSPVKGEEGTEILGDDIDVQTIEFPAPTHTFKLCKDGDVIFDTTKVPNLFHQFMQRLFLGIYWGRI